MCSQLLFRYISVCWTHFAANFNFKSFSLKCAQLLLKLFLVISDYAYANFSMRACVMFCGQMFVPVAANLRSFIATNVDLKAACWICLRECYRLSTYLHSQLDARKLVSHCASACASCVKPLWNSVPGPTTMEVEHTDLSGEEELEDTEVLEQKAMTAKVTAVEEAIRNRHATVIAAADTYRDHALASLALYQRRQPQQPQRRPQPSQEKGLQLRSTASTTVFDLVAKISSFIDSSCSDERSQASSSTTLHASMSTTFLDRIYRLTSFYSDNDHTGLDLDSRKLLLLSSVFDFERNSRRNGDGDKQRKLARKERPDVSFSSGSSDDEGSSPGSGAIPDACTNIQRPVLRFHASTNVILHAVRDFLGAVETMELCVGEGFRDSAELMFRCGKEVGELGTASDVGISSLEVLPDSTVRISYKRRGLREDCESEVRDRLGNLLPQHAPFTATDSSLGKLWDTVTSKPTASTHTSFFKRLSTLTDHGVLASSQEGTTIPCQAKRRHFTGDRVWLMPNLTVKGSTVMLGDGPDCEKGSSTVLLYLLDGDHIAFDVDFQEELVVVLEEANPPSTTQRTVKLYQYPRSDESWASALRRTMSTRDWKRGLRAGQLVANYIPPTKDFLATDVCFFPVHDSGFKRVGVVVMIADEINDAIHVVELVREDSIQNYPSASSSFSSASPKWFFKEKQTSLVPFRSSSSPFKSSSSPHTISPSSPSAIKELRFVRFLAAGSPLLVQPTALGVDSSSRSLLVACRSGAVLTVTPDLCHLSRKT